VMVME